MASFRLSRSLMGILALISLSMSACIVGFCTFTASNTSMAQGFVAPVPTGCAKPSSSANTGNIQDATGTLRSISGQKLTITNPQGLSISATYSSTTQFTQRKSVTTAALKPGVHALVQAIPNANGTTYTAERITLVQEGPQKHIDCLPDNNPNRLPSTSTSSRQSLNRGCFGDFGPRQRPSSAIGQASSSIASSKVTDKSTCIVGTIQQFTGTTLTVKDILGKSHTITLTKTTVLIQETSATSAALKVNTFVTVIGPKINGVISAFRITISDKLPTGNG